MRTKKPQNEIRQPTSDELDERILMCRRLLGQGLYDSQIRKAVAKHFGICTRTVARYLCRVRSIICAETGRSKDELRQDVYANLVEIRQTATQPMAKIKANEVIIDLLGLAEPKTVRNEHKGSMDVTTGGKPIDSGTNARIDSLRDLLGSLAERGRSVEPEGIHIGSPSTNGTGHA